VSFHTLIATAQAVWTEEESSDRVSFQTKFILKK